MKAAKQYRRKFTWCGSCDRKMQRVYKAPQRTAYHDPEANFFYGCRQCHEYNDQYWDEMWREYYGSIL